MVCDQKFTLVWRYHPLLSRFLAKVPCLECHVSPVCQLMTRVIMRWHHGLCTDLLAFALRLTKTRKTSARRPSDRLCAQSLPQRGSLLPNEVDKVGKKKKTGYHISTIVFFFRWTWSHGQLPKDPYTSVAVLPAPIRGPSQRPLAPSVTSVRTMISKNGYAT